MKKNNEWRGYSRQELAQRRSEALQNMRVEIGQLNAGIRSVRQNNIFKPFDIVKSAARVIGYFGIFKLVFKALKLLRRFRL